MIELIQAVARASRCTRLAVEDFCRRAKISRRRVRRLGPWRELCAAAGIEPVRPAQILGDGEIFGAMRDAFISAGGIVSLARFRRHFRFSHPVFRYRNMNWAETLVAFRAWALRHAPDFPFLGHLPVTAPDRRGRPCRLAEKNTLRANAPPPQPAALAASAGPPSGPHWPAVPGHHMGDLIKFRSLIHAPTNEQGVIFLFGVVAAELGYAVDGFLTRYFPDCSGARRVANGKWQRVRIEFEFQSRNFVSHGHDPEKCDVIVCWEHNWPDCPLEVLELRTTIRAMAA